MGKSLNKKAKRVLLTRQKLKVAAPKGKESNTTKKRLAEFQVNTQGITGKVRYRGVKRRQVAPLSSLGKGVVIEKIKEDVTKMVKGEKVKDDAPKPQIFKGTAQSEEQRSATVKKETEHLEYVLNCDEFKTDPSAAILNHISATLDPLIEAKGRHKYNPSKKKKLENEKAKEQKVRKESAAGQLKQLEGFQSVINATPYGKGIKGKSKDSFQKRDGKAKPAPKGRKAGQSRSNKPWLSPN
eukprot:TRINITY_DN4996_c0_g2_i3.p1 TRINITY_DN4996_c0_g2~~TRINITY_DN4996_c0_g2_i3.p1  ORF type:complete len:254 (+),score=95.20 TRINITY_DN4996_c0_g2_i3:44-763(+)